MRDIDMVGTENVIPVVTICRPSPTGVYVVVGTTALSVEEVVRFTGRVVRFAWAGVRPNEFIRYAAGIYARNVERFKMGSVFFTTYVTLSFQTWLGGTPAQMEGICGHEPGVRISSTSSI
jgi:hypothetical protein